NQYRWRVRSHNQYGWSSYSKYSYFKVAKIIQPQIPIPEREELQFSSLTPVLYWSKVPSVDGYGIYLFKVTSTSKAELIFSNSDSNFIQDTFFIIPKSLLEYGNKYLWFIRAHNEYGWSENSDTNYFSIKSVEKPKAPYSLSPGYLNEETEVMFEIPKSLIWNATSNCKGYQIRIEKMGINNFFDLINKKDRFVKAPKMI
ncbi:MAG: hypothetical protein QW050_02590, partial [Candidatus Nitrosocaldaceae archaeon]